MFLTRPTVKAVGEIRQIALRQNLKLDPLTHIICSFQQRVPLFGNATPNPHGKRT